MSKFKHYFKLITINVVVTVLLVELVAMIYIHKKQPQIPAYARIPTYIEVIKSPKLSFKGVLNGELDTLYTNPISPRCIDTLYPWCTWHPTNRIHREVYPCFDVLYKFNSFGTRGSLPNTNVTSTILFIGDSFVEGFGLDEDSTLPERIHHQLQRPVLNLGTSGHFGSTQMSLVYAHFAQLFKHKEVFVFLFPENDFMENRVSEHSKSFSHRYRPYRILKGDSSKIIYKGAFDSTRFSWRYFNSLNKLALPLFSNNESLISKCLRMTYTRRLFTLLRTNAKNKNAPIEKLADVNYSTEDFGILETDIKSMLNTAQSSGAQITFIALPSQNFLRLSQNSEPLAKEFIKLESKIKSIAMSGGGHYLSLFQYLRENQFPIDPLFFPCDAHLSNHGEAVLAEFIKRNLLRN